jgi:hypothetical protein
MVRVLDGGEGQTSGLSYGGEVLRAPRITLGLGEILHALPAFGANRSRRGEREPL